MILSFELHKWAIHGHVNEWSVETIFVVGWQTWTVETKLQGWHYSINIRCFFSMQRNLPTTQLLRSTLDISQVLLIAIYYCSCSCRQIIDIIINWMCTWLFSCSRVGLMYSVSLCDVAVQLLPFGWKDSVIRMLSSPTFFLSKRVTFSSIKTA